MGQTDRSQALALVNRARFYLLHRYGFGLSGRIGSAAAAPIGLVLYSSADVAGCQTGFPINVSRVSTLRIARIDRTVSGSARDPEVGLHGEDDFSVLVSGSDFHADYAVSRFGAGRPRGDNFQFG